MAAPITIKDAPRDVAELAKLGRFQLRMLATLLKMFDGDDSEEQKGAFMKLATPEMASAVATVLEKLDGGGTKSGRQPSNKGKKGAAATAPASEDKPAKSDRTPVTSGTSSGDGGKAMAAITALARELKTAQEIGAATNRFVMIAIGILLKLAEQTLDASAEDVLGMVEEDSSSVEKILGKLIKGNKKSSKSAPAKEEEEDEEEEDEEDEDEEGN